MSQSIQDTTNAGYAFRACPLPQVMILYMILFWLGSLVRYNPHSVRALMDSEYSVLVDGFMSQSRL
jgi:hypothetical protein